VIFKPHQHAVDRIVQTFIVKAVRRGGEGSSERQITGLDGQVGRLGHERVDEGVGGLSHRTQRAYTRKQCDHKQGQRNPSQHFSIHLSGQRQSPASFVCLSIPVKFGVMK
jgi:hypothetical protein